MERRSFFSRIAAALGIASASALLTVTDVDAETNTITLEPSVLPTYYLVDSTRMDLSELSKTMTVPGVIDARSGDIFISYFPSPSDNFPAIMKVPEASREDVSRLMRPPHREALSADDERIIRTLREGTRIY